MNGTQFIARILKEEGVEQMTCFPSNALIEAVSKEDADKAKEAIEAAGGSVDLK